MSGRCEATNVAWLCCASISALRTVTEHWVVGGGAVKSEDSITFMRTGWFVCLATGVTSMAKQGPLVYLQADDGAST